MTYEKKKRKLGFERQKLEMEKDKLEVVKQRTVEQMQHEKQAKIDLQNTWLGLVSVGGGKSLTGVAKSVNK